MSQFNPVKYWSISLLLSIAAIVVIGLQWFQVQREHVEGTNIIKNQAQLEAHLVNADTIEFKDGRRPYLVPVGFFLQSLAFVSSSDVNITGYIWQKYPEDMPEEILREFVFPEEVNSGSTDLEEFYRVKKEQDGISYQTIGWYFDVTLRQTYDYSKYPLDYLTVWIRIWPKDFKNDNKVFYVPDFQAYTKNEKDVFGLDQDIVPGEWIIDETFFSYHDMPYDTDFGFYSKPETAVKYKEFYINVGLKRKFINAFIINLVPLFVVALLLFAQMMIVTGSEELVNRFGFSTGETIATCSALFFVVLLAHVQVRKLFAGSGLVYIEYFYLIMYIVILLTALNSYIFSLGKLKYLSLIHYRDNIIIKAAYWPFVLWMMATVTLIKL